MTKARRAVAGLGVLATSVATPVLALAHADPAPGQDINNDWGQSPAQVAVEITSVVDADARVVAARTRYLKALAAYADGKKRHLAAATVYAEACEVVASQLAMTKTVDAVTALVRSYHYVKAPYVAVPAQPQALVAQGQSGQVALTWTAVPGATAYKVLRDGHFVAVTLVPTFLDTALDNGTAYAYAVIATNVAGWSTRSAEVVGTPTLATPDVPTGLVATPGDGQVSLAWTASTGATGYRVFRGGTLVGSPATPAFTDTGLTNGTSYAYTLQAVNDTVFSVPSAAVATVPVATAPAAPAGLVASAGDTTVALSWTPVAGATSYQVRRNGTPVGSPTLPSFTDTGLTNGTSYSWTVVAFRQNSPASASSAPVSATPVTPPLSTPTGLAATPGDGQVSLSWNAVPGATTYRLYRGATLVVNQAATGYVDSGLTNGTTYSWTVVAVGPSSTSAASASASATPAAAAPGAPTGLTGQAGDTSVTLSWTAVSGAGSYKVYRGGTLLTTVTMPSFVDTGLTNGTAYSYRVTAVRSGVESALSSTVSVTPVAVVPGTPTGLVGSPGNAQVVLTWSASANAQSYRVYRGGTLVGTPTATSLTDTGLTNGTAYSYTVVAVNGSASSAASSAVSVTPMAPAPPTPTGLTATPGNAQVQLSWTASSGATGYRVYRGGVLVGSPTATSYLDTGLVNGTSYTWTVVAVAATTPSAPTAGVSATPVKPPVNGTFTGATASIASGHGTIRVVIVISNSKITQATGTLLSNDGSETVSINNTAIPQYNSKAVTASSAAITKVSGATLTWTAYKTSLQSALTQAGL